MKYIIGIDDAGRGPVIGPMILAGVLIKESDLDRIKETGAKDSKLLSSGVRKKLGEAIKRDFEHHVEKTLPKEIDDCDNLNNLEAVKAAMIINSLAMKVSGEIEVIVDCPSVNTKAWAEFLEKLVESKNKIIIRAEHKADFNYPIVSAASIIAKETREEEVAKLKKELGVDFGSGYPSDPKTKEFIEKNHENEMYSSVIRHSWDTVKRLKIGKNQKKLF